MRFASKLFLFLLYNSSNYLIAQDVNPPPPPSNQDDTGPPGLLIDEYIVMVFIVALVFGIIITLKRMKQHQGLKS